MLEWLCNLDQSFLLFLQNYVREDFLTFAMRGITILGNAGMIWILITVILLLMPKYRKLGLTCGVALLLSLLINNLFLKNVIARTRPFDAIEGLIPLIPHPIDFSFPSGHTASSFAAGFLLFRRLPEKIRDPDVWSGNPDQFLQIICRCALSKRCACGHCFRNLYQLSGRVDRASDYRESEVWRKKKSKLKNGNIPEGTDKK